MLETIKIFVGADSDGADFAELDRLRRKSEKYNYSSYRHWIFMKEKFGESRFDGKNIILRGGQTGYCIAHCAEFLLKRGAKNVIIDLPNCRSDQNDLINNIEIFNQRQEEVILGIDREFRNNERLKFKL